MLIKPITASPLHDTLIQQLRIGGYAPRPRLATAATEEQILRQRHAGQRVLIAQENPINRLVAVELLRAVGLVVESAVNGSEAVEMAQSRHVDLILMDMQMPVKDGFSAAREIRSTSNVIIIAMTEGASLEDRTACLASGMNGHISKPVHPSQLSALLLRWLPETI